MRLVALAVGFGLGLAMPAAAEQRRTIDGWLVVEDRDRFDGSEKAVAVREGRLGTALLVRCSRGSFVIVVIDGGGHALAGAERMVTAKMRVDNGPIRPTVAEFTTAHAAELVTDRNMVVDLQTGREAAIRFEGRSRSYDYVFRLGRPGRPLLRLLRLCAKSE